ncbi:nuclease-related domain-containing protein [Agromyces kandeliae]|uniref:NERD domain-containing protein n=1 Tax=Agromyces kandeliae TaxID=2666141 RepID=A0A6L5R374_9MICO|nr:nuclease-related domain-containing protein [Agromyces kandeliae]MRX44516.1 NERD domain-containing protein [Agromyces kandeliae]
MTRPEASSLVSRRPAASVIAECLRVQSTVPPNTAVQRFFGVSPLGRDAEPWYVGALGELQVARRLEALGPEWVVLHSVPVGTGSSDLDHVVIGRAGVFTINTKHHRGQPVWVGAKRILVNGQRTDHLRNAAYEAKRAAKLLSAATGTPLEVTPIIAIVGAKRMTVRQRPADVVVLRESNLVRWLRRRRAVLTPEQVRHLAAVAARPEAWGRMAQAEPVDHAAFDRLRGAITSAQHRRTGWVLAGLAGLILAAIAGFPAWSDAVGALIAG